MIRGRQVMKATALVLGPADHGRPITRGEFDAATGTEGHRYELIRGRVYVSPVPQLPHDIVVLYLHLCASVFIGGH
jgi:hypothetical protein